MDIQVANYKLRSSSGEGDLFGRAWIPAVPRAVIVIAHGMSEHSGRYRRVGELLAKNGYACFAHDHLGHGRSTMNHPGTFSLKGRGFEYVINDLRRDLRQAGKRYPGLPRILVGHSMGSILSGIIADRYGDELDGLVLLGTPSPNPLAGGFSLFCRSIAAVKGPVYESKLVNWLLNSATSGNGEESLSERQWLSNNRESNLAFMNDPLCGTDFSCSANAESAAGLREFGSSRWGKGVPKDLPVLIMAGSDDSAGNRGEAPRHYAQQLRHAGVKDVTLFLVPGGRHEVFNEPDTRRQDELFLSWLNRVTKDGRRGSI